MVSGEVFMRLFWRWPIFTAATIVLIALGLRIYATMPLKSAKITPITYPKPNGFDDFVDADSKLSPQINNFEGNGLLKKTQPAHRMPGPSAAESNGEATTYTIQEITGAISDNEPAFQEVEHGLSLPCVSGCDGSTDQTGTLCRRQHPECCEKLGLRRRRS